MSRMKDDLGGAFGGSSRGRWRDAKRCPVCERAGWCQVARDGRTVLCKRVASPVERESRDGSTYWVHHLDGAARAPRVRDDAPAPSALRASADVRHAAYRAVLDALTLSPAHRDNLRARGLDEASIARGAYRTLELRGRAALARVIVDAVGEQLAAGVPGIARAEAEGRSWLTLKGASGLLVPVRDLEGRIVALKVRRDDAGGGPKYLSLSSASHGGASAENAVHVPTFAARDPGGELLVTEGELKADVATLLARRPVLSVPGVGAWRLALPVVAALRPGRVLVAFDSDAIDNPDVATAAERLLRALRNAGVRAALHTWPAAHGKGLDDLLLRRVVGAGVSS